MAPPVFVNCRDRVTTLVELVSWLERAGCEEIHLLDNDSTYEPLLEFYRQTPHSVVRLGENYGRLALFEAPGVLARAGGKGFVYTDPDVVPAPDCPLDALDHLDELLARYPTVSKVGFGLRVDVPDHYAHKEAVVTWEQQFWQRELEPGAYHAPIDTTFVPAGAHVRHRRGHPDGPALRRPARHVVPGPRRPQRGGALLPQPRRLGHGALAPSPTGARPSCPPTSSATSRRSVGGRRPTPAAPIPSCPRSNARDGSSSPSRRTRRRSRPGPGRAGVHGTR